MYLYQCRIRNKLFVCLYLQGYQVFYTLKPEEPVFFWQKQEVKNSNRLCTIAGLQANKTYTISILAFSVVGPGPMSHPIQVLTAMGGKTMFKNLKTLPEFVLRLVIFNAISSFRSIISRRS